MTYLYQKPIEELSLSDIMTGVKLFGDLPGSEKSRPVGAGASAGPWADRLILQVL